MLRQISTSLNFDHEIQQVCICVYVGTIAAQCLWERALARGSVLFLFFHFGRGEECVVRRFRARVLFCNIVQAAAGIHFLIERFWEILFGVCTLAVEV